MEEKIKLAIEELNPYLEMHDGFIEFIKYENNIVYVKMSGHCQNCEMIDVTLKDGILSYLQEKFPEIEGIINVDLEV